MSHHEKIGLSDEWYTPNYIFDKLGCTFDMDVASPVDRTYCSVPAVDFITENSLEAEWNGFVWMNPPFGGRNGIVPWLHKMYKHANGIALTPDRTSAPWWQECADRADGVLFISGKVKFINEHGIMGGSPSTGTCLFAFGKQAVSALNTAYYRNLGCFVLLNL